MDDYSRAVFVYLLKGKSEVLPKFKEFEAWATTYTGTRVKTFDQTMEESISARPSSSTVGRREFSNSSALHTHLSRMERPNE